MLRDSAHALHLISVVVLSAGCSQRSLVVVSVDSHDTLAEVQTLHVTASVGAKTVEYDFGGAGTTPFTIPPMKTLGFDVSASYSGELDVKVQAYDSVGSKIAEGQGSAPIRAGDTSSLTIVMGGDPRPDLGSDGALADVAKPSYAQQVMADVPLAYWRLGEAATPAAADATGNGNTGTYTGGVTVGVQGALAGDADTAILLDGISGYVSLGDKFQMAGNAPFSIEAWIKPTTIDATYREVFSKFLHDASFHGYYLTLQDTDGLSFTRARPGSAQSVALLAGIPKNVFSHVIVTYDGVMLRLYVNGVSAVAPVSSNAMIETLATTCEIGNDVASNHFAGVIDEVAIYDHSLLPARVTAHFVAGSP